VDGLDVLQKMSALKTAMFLALACSGCLAREDFGFCVTDEVKTDKLHYEFVQNINIVYFESQLPRFIYSKGYTAYGINQDTFTVTSEKYAGDLSRADYALLLKRAHDLPLKGLDPKKEGDDATRSFGTIKLEGVYHKVTAKPDIEIRKQWQRFLDNLISEHAPMEKREITRRTVEGETVTPKVIDFPTLLKSPKDYDGKRIRLTGFYHGGFEVSSFAATKAGIRDYGKALWMGGPSSFSDPKRISDRNDVTLSVDGTFNFGRGGNGLWMGELVRITESKPTKAEQIGVGQPASAPESKADGNDKPQPESKPASR
jgi:hypothetical protein